MATELDAAIENLKVIQAKDQKWRKGPKITRKDIDLAIKNGGELEMPPDEMQMVDKIIKFGKHKGKTYNWVYKNDKYWFTWAMDNIQGFRAKAEAAKYKQE